MQVDSEARVGVLFDGVCARIFLRRCARHFAGGVYACEQVRSPMSMYTCACEGRAGLINAREAAQVGAVGVVQVETLPSRNNPSHAI